MMETHNLIELLQEKTLEGWILWTEDDKLRFKAPNSKGTEDTINVLKEYKFNIIELLVNNPDILNIHPLSHVQKGLWLNWKLEPNSTAFNIAIGFRICSAINKNNITKSLQTIVGRHAMLRSNFSQSKNIIYQRINTDSKLDFEHINTQGIKEEELRKIVSTHQNTPFNIENDPLFRVRLFSLSENEHLIIFVTHHIIADAMSQGIITEEFLNIYHALEQKHEYSLTNLQSSFIEYINSQNKLISSPKGDRLWKFWKNKLAGELPVLNLSTDRPRPTIQTTNGSSISFNIDNQLSIKLRLLAKENGVTLYVVLLSAYKALLHRYTHQEEFIIGSPMASRSQSYYYSHVGCFVNPVAIRTKFNGNTTFEQLLANVNREVLEAMNHQDYPFPLLVEKLNTKRNSSYTPIYQATFNLHNFNLFPSMQRLLSEGEVKRNGLLLKKYDLVQQEGQGDLYLELIEQNDNLYGALKFNSDIFLKETIKRYTSHFEKILESIVKNPNNKISDLEILPDKEKKLLTYDFNDTCFRYPKDICIHQLFEKQVEENHENIALIFKDEQLTYKEFNSRANKVARFLQQKGVKAESFVCICIERSIDMMVGIFAIMKAGGAYVPIDPLYPEERINYILKNSGSSILLTDKAIIDHLPKNIDAEILCLDNDEFLQEIEQMLDKNLNIKTQSHNLAYVIYTSGSTGNPKGTLIEHQALVNRLDWMQRCYPINKDDTLIQKTTYSFDVSVWELFWWSLYGAKVCLLEPGSEKEPEKIVNTIKKNNVTTIHFVPSMYSIFLNFVNTHKAFKQTASLKQIFTSGETLTAGHVADSKEIISKNDTKLTNLYGPTEATIDVSYYNCGIDDEIIPIGKPISNIQLYILDKTQNIVPLGVTGELCIAGDGLARGYLNQPKLNREKFVNNPFNTSPKQRMYKTGDLVRFLPDGNIEFLGRIDNQVKIRGFRIELGEIENAIDNQEEIGTSVVLAHNDSLGNKLLVAYVVAANNNTSLNIEKLRGNLKKRLPDYMVPTLFIKLDKIPLSHNGKINRKALPKPNKNIETSTKYIAPQTVIEKQIAEVWKEALRIEKVGIHDNFFELGGHSLLATQIISHLKSKHNYELSLMSLFQNNTIHAISKLIEFEESQEKIKVQPRDIDLQLSFSQERLWFIDQYSHDNSYSIPRIIRFQGKINVTSLQHTLEKIIDRHEILRTNFISENGVQKQKINKKSFCELVIEDFSHLDYQTAEKIIIDKIEHDSAIPFNLEKDSLIRVVLYKIKAEKHILYINMHHIITDGWSFSVLTKEVALIYAAIENNNPQLVQELPIQYADYAIWQREYLSPNGLVFQKQSDYWKNQLKDIKTLELPTDFTRPKEQTFRGNSISVQINNKVADKIHKLSTNNNATLFMSLLSVFKILLYKYTGQSDICIGSPIANRTKSETENLIGFFVNTLALRSTVNEKKTFLELLEHVKNTTLQAYENQEIPFEKIVELINPERNLAYSPLFQVMLVLQNKLEDELSFSGITLEPIEYKSTVSQFDLTLDISETKAGLLIRFEYNTDLFKQSTIERMIGHFTHLINQIISNPHTPIKNLEIIPPEEKQLLIHNWNANKLAFENEKTIHKLFEEQVEKNPENIAITFNNKSITYKELDEKANQIGNHLQSLGVQPDDIIGLCLDRSIDMITCLLGIIKSGGAYLPIDPTYPAERIAFMINDCNCKFILSNSFSENIFEKYRFSKFINLDDKNVQSDIKNCSTKRIISKVKANNLLYIIYTSGSTGNPKGVMIEHRNVVNLIQAQLKAFQVTSDEKILQFSSICFDAAVEQINLALLSGATLVLIDKELIIDLEQFNKYIISKGVTHIHAVPEFIKKIANQNFPSVKRIISGGDKCPIEIAKKIATTKNFINEYGPTETTVTSIQKLYLTNKPGPVNNTIGKPIFNTQVYILDRNLKPVPIGIAGELYIAGNGVARGYLNNEKLTKEKFIPNPFCPDQNSTMYRSGDLARYIENGEIQFLSRVDNQIKIRGYRIELGEIESILNSIKNINASIADVKEDTSGNKQIIAYYTVNQKNSIKVEEIRQILANKLPNYMIPALFVEIDKLPLLPNGKINRKNLPDPNTSFEKNREFVPASTETEKKLIRLWEETLTIENIGIYDNFFELGGHSLIVTQLISKIRNEFAVNIPVKALFQNTTIHSLSSIIEKEKSTDNKLFKIPKCNIDNYFPLSFSQERLWFINQFDQNASYNMPGALRFKGEINLDILEQAIYILTQRHNILRTNFRTNNKDNSIVQFVKKESDCKLQIKDYSHLNTVTAKDRIQKSILKETEKPFNLEKDSLLRIIAYKINSSDYILFINQHHIISDGWSLNIFFKEISIIYKELKDGSVSTLPKLTVQYGDFSVWQREQLSSEILKTQAEYWKSKLEHVPILKLPIDKIRPKELTYNGRTEEFTISQNITSKLQQISIENDATLFMTILSIYKLLLYNYTSQADFCIGIPIANRNISETENLLGFFVNTLAIRCNISDKNSFTHFLKQIKTTTLEAYDNEDIPFEKIVEILEPERNLSYSPVFQVMMAMQNNTKDNHDIGNLSLEKIHLPSCTAKFELTLNITETKHGLSGEFEYNTDLFNSETINKMIGHFIQLTNEVVKNPDSLICDLEILTNFEKHKILIDWNSTRKMYPKKKCIHQLFAEQVIKTPDKIALIYKDHRMTFKELDNKSNKISHFLRKKGLIPGQFVGVCINRTPNMVSCILGVLKAGGAYIPIDPSNPSERITYMLESSNCHILLTQNNISNSLKVSSEIEVLNIDNDNIIADINRAPNHNLALPLDSNNTIYGIFTSGSTGKPKAATVNHCNFVNLMNWYSQYFSSKDSTLLVTSYSFDLTQKNIFIALMNGGKLALSDFNIVNPEQVISEIRSFNITSINCTPSMFDMLLYIDRINDYRNLKSITKVFLGGEPINLSELKKWKESENFNADIFNTYGPTECTDICLSHKINWDKDITFVPTGKPIDNCNVYILNHFNKLAPVGIFGELCIGGAGLGNGYMNHPKLTKEKFISVKLNKKETYQIYKTGDIARYLPNGIIEYIGRKDDQLKIRGFRIELGEIESTLNTINQVRSATVIARKNKVGLTQIAAYIVPSSDYPFDDEGVLVDSIRNSLNNQLPDYMIPTFFIIMDKLPLTANGKINKKALPEPEENFELSNKIVEPQTNTEIQLTNIWKDVLGIEKIGIYDNFFHIGGHSLLATKVISKIKTSFNCNIPLKLLFQSTTIYSIAQIIDSREFENAYEEIQVNENKQFSQQNLDLENIETEKIII